MNVNKEIENFSKFLNSTFAEICSVSKSVEEKDIIRADKIENGYLQFVWEIMVESLVCKKLEYLEPYGDGADFEDESSRVTYPKEHSNMRIIVHAKGGKNLLSGENLPNENLELNKLVSFNGGKYFTVPPFDFVLCEDSVGNQVVMEMDNVNFVLETTGL